MKFIKAIVVGFLASQASLIFSVSNNDSDITLIDDLESSIRYWQNEYSFRCQDSFPSKEDRNDEENCDDGDSAIFNGILCYSGVEEGCRTVRDSQATSGQWYRSPRRMKNGGGNSKANFSRDQMMGLLLYFVKTKDKRSAEKWWKWVNRKQPRTVCSNNDLVCILIDNLSLSLIAKVFNYIGMDLDPDLQRLLNRKKPVENAATTRVTISAANPGYVSHNYIITLLIHHHIDPRGHLWKDYWTKTLLNKKDMDNNPFFQYVAKKTCPNNCRKVPPTNKIIKNMLNKCPKVDGRINHRNQWSWERTNKGSPWKNSMGWECVSLGKLLLNGIHTP